MNIQAGSYENKVREKYCISITLYIISFERISSQQLKYNKRKGDYNWFFKSIVNEHTMIDLLDFVSNVFRVLFYVLTIFLGWFEAKIFTSDKKITEHTLKYYIVSILSFVISTLFIPTEVSIIFYRLLVVVIIYSIWRYKEESPLIVFVSLILIQLYGGFILLLVVFFSNLIMTI